MISKTATFPTSRSAAGSSRSPRAASDDVLAQNSSSALAIALVNDTDWTDYQRIEADITPTFGTGDSWAGLVARYVDANNYYFAVIRANDAMASTNA